MKISSKKFYTVQDLCEMFGVKEMTVYGWIWSGKLDALKVGQWRITEDQLQAFLQAGRRRNKKQNG